MGGGGTHSDIVLVQNILADRVAQMPQIGAFGFDQENLFTRLGDGNGIELYELHILHHATGLVGQGMGITADPLWVVMVQEQRAGTARRQDHRAAAQLKPLPLPSAIGGQADAVFTGGNGADHQVVDEAHADFLGLGHQGMDDFPAPDRDPVAGIALGQGHEDAWRGFRGHAPIDQILEPRARLRSRDIDHLGLVQAAPGGQHPFLVVVFRHTTPRAREGADGEGGRSALARPAFTHHGDIGARQFRLDGGHQTRRSRANNPDIRPECFRCFHDFIPL